MTNRAEEHEQTEPAALAQLTAQIVAAFVSRNTVAIADLGHLIDTVGRQLSTLGQADTEPAARKPGPAVPVRRSVQEDHLVCLVCGRQQKILRRHLAAAHQLSPAAYRELFGLRRDYPMAAPSYARQRSEMAQRLGLGRRSRTPPPRQRRKGQD